MMSKNNLVRGGQGRTGEQVQEETSFYAVTFALTFFPCLFLLFF